jgi:hypothetical protein
MNRPLGRHAGAVSLDGMAEALDGVAIMLPPGAPASLQERRGLQRRCRPRKLVRCTSSLPPTPPRSGPP